MNRVNAGAYCIRLTLTAIIAIATAFTFNACGGNDSGEGDDPPSSSSGSGDKTYTVTFDADNGTENIIQTVAEGSKAAKPANPIKNGYVFAFWFDENYAIENGHYHEWDFNWPITENTFLKARWSTVLDETKTIVEKYRGKWEVYSATIDEESYTAPPFGSFYTIGYEIGNNYVKIYDTGTIVSDIELLYSTDNGDSDFIHYNWVIDGSFAPPPYLRITSNENGVVISDYFLLTSK